MELGVRQFRWHGQFHGIPWNFDDMSSSMEFHGTLGAPISMTRAVPWNSMEFRWHEQFHGIPWNFGCANFADMSSSMEFHGIPWNLECANFANTSSSMEFHGIPWNLECANFADTSSFMEFHGTRSAPISLTRAVPWNSMELRVRQFRWHQQFHGIPWNSMELEVRQFRWHEKFPGIPWNLECANFADTSSSMEFHGTWNTPISLTRAVPWNSMELGVRQFRWHKQFHGIPCN